MSIYPPSSPHTRQASTTSTSSLGGLSTYSFPSTRSATPSSASSLSSRFGKLESRSGNLTAGLPHAASLGGPTPMLSTYTTNLPKSSSGGGSTTNVNDKPSRQPTPLTPPRNSSPLARLPSHNRGASAPNFPANPNVSPSAAPRPTPSPYNSAHRNSVIAGTSSLKKDELTHLRNSSVSHFRTLSRLTNEGNAEEFGIVAGASEDVAGMHGRKRLQRAQTDNMTSWERMTWMDKRRQYIQAYEYLCHIGEAKE